jgi:ATP-dependent DNA helicase RecQ
MEQLDPATEQVLVLLMRRYPGIFVQDAFIDEDALASELNIDTRKLHEAFLALSRRKIIRYIPGDDNPYIVYHMPRFPVSYLTFDQNVYEKRKRAFARRIAAMSAYIEERHQCRQLYLLAYFGQQERERCGICDTCLAAKKHAGLDDHAASTNRVELDATILRLLSENELELRELTRTIDADPEQILVRIRLLLDEGLISYASFDRLRRLPPKGPVDSTALPPDED